MVIGAVYVTMGQMIRLLQLYVDNLDILQMVGIIVGKFNKSFKTDRLVLIHLCIILFI